MLYLVVGLCYLATSLWARDWPLWIPVVWLAGAVVWFVREQYGERRSREGSIN